MRKSNVLIAHFPRTTLGYSIQKVDEFVQSIGERLEDLQAQIDEMSEKNERLVIEAQNSRKALLKDGEREAALANAIVSIEQRKIDHDEQLRCELAAAQSEASRIIESAQSEANELLQIARSEAGALIRTAEQQTQEELSRFNQLVTNHNRMIDSVQQALGQHIASLATSKIETPALICDTAVVVQWSSIDESVAA